MAGRVPTVDDLRVKLCYICREEERADTPSDNPPRPWTHPCNCTLIAHEDCLLRWIQTSQSTPSRAAQALKCPQCGTSYELESNGSVLLDVLGSGNKLLQRMGRYFTVFAAAATAGLVGTTVYVCLTAYGAWAVKQFIGTEMFDLILTDDPANWTWQAYVNLPLLPISLILSRFPRSSSSMVVPLLLVWPPSTPVGEKSRSLLDYWRRPENHARLTQVAALRSLWPPPPMFLGVFGIPIVRHFYRKLYARAYEALLGAPMPSATARRRPGPGAGDLGFQEGPFVIRIRANMENVVPGQVNGAANGAAVAGQAGGEVGEDDEQQAVANADPNVAAIEAAEQIIQVDAASLGRRVAGALLVPAISNIMGSALFALSKHSPLLSAFLGIRRPPVGANGGKRYPLPPFSLAALAPPHVPWSELTVPQKAKTGLKLIVSAFLGGTRQWVNSDPVWWRNGVGFALFTVAKDCVYLLHLWLAKRELESRRVKNNDFKGVDIAELDLLDSFQQPAP